MRESEAYIVWRNDILIRATVGIPVKFAGQQYLVDLTEDGRKILIHAQPQVQQAA